MDDATADTAERIAPLSAIIKEHGLSALVLRRAPNVAWATGGRVHVAMAIDASVADVLITGSPQGLLLRVLTSVIEAPRLGAEELPASAVVQAMPWWLPRELPADVTGRVGSDSPRTGEVDVAQAVEAVRQHLTDAECERYRATARRVIDTMETVLRQSRSTLSEREVAGMLSGALASRGLECLVLLVAGDERRLRFRHPLPTPGLIGECFFASVCARERGLIVSATRVVSFRPVPEVDRRAYQGLLAVEARLLDGTVPGRVMGEVLTDAVAEYAKAGPPLHPDEWHRHHQGGPTGYLPRDWPVTPTTTAVIANQQAFAWNPTGGGLKVEDTVLSSPTGAVPLAASRGWPTIEVAGRLRPDILIA